MQQFLFEYGSDLRILVRCDFDNEEAPVYLFNADDLSEIPNPPEGSPLRNALLMELAYRSLSRAAPPSTTVQ